MAERKTQRNTRRSIRRSDFGVCSEPIVSVPEKVRSPDIAESLGLPRISGRPILFAIARDEHTIFACWNIDWPFVFQKNLPADRQVYLRVFDSDGCEREKVAVEPMLGTHFLTTSGLRDPFRVEIGYHQPAGTWHSVAISNEIQATTTGSTEIADADVATIPLHLGFEELVNLFGATNDTPLANVISRFQTRVLNSRWPNGLPPAATQILRKLNLSLPAIAVARRDFEKIDTAKLARHRRALFQFAGTSPSRGFEENAGS
jgi:hypothetical protein